MRYASDNANALAIVLSMTCFACPQMPHKHLVFIDWLSLVVIDGDRSASLSPSLEAYPGAPPAVGSCSLLCIDSGVL